VTSHRKIRRLFSQRRGEESAAGGRGRGESCLWTGTNYIRAKNAVHRKCLILRDRTMYITLGNWMGVPNRSGGEGCSKFARTTRSQSKSKACHMGTGKLELMPEAIYICESQGGSLGGEASAGSGTQLADLHPAAA